MSEANGYATKEALLQMSKKPRSYADVDIPGWGKIQVQTIDALAFCRIEAAKNRALSLSSSANRTQAANAIRDYAFETIKAIVSQPAFCDADLEVLFANDPALVEAIREACMNHCDRQRADAGAAQKN